MPGANLGPDYDFPKRLSALESKVDQLSTRDVLQSASIGVGGITVYGGSITVTGTGSISLTSGTLSAFAVVGTSSVSTNSLAVGAGATIGANLTVSGQIFIPNGFAAVSGYTVAYVDGTGRISVGASALRFKQDFEPVDQDSLINAIYDADLIHFRLIAAVEQIDHKMGPLEEGEERGTAPVEIGLIADQLEQIGLSEFVYRDAEGAPLGHKKKNHTVPLPAVVQSLDRRLRAAGL